MAFIGLHVTLPGQSGSKIGKVSTDRDMDVVKNQGTKGPTQQSAH